MCRKHETILPIFWIENDNSYIIDKGNDDAFWIIPIKLPRYIHEFPLRYEVELIIFQIEMAEIVLSRRSVTGRRQQTRGRGQKLD